MNAPAPNLSQQVANRRAALYRALWRDYGRDGERKPFLNLLTVQPNQRKQGVNQCSPFY